MAWVSKYLCYQVLSRGLKLTFSMLDVADVAASLFSVMIFSLVKVACVTELSVAAMEPRAI